MRKLAIIFGCLAGCAAAVFIGLPFLTVAVPQVGEQVIAWSCKQPSVTCQIKMRAMGHVWSRKGNLERAKIWYARAAEEGDAASMFHLAWVYEQFALNDVKLGVRSAAALQDDAGDQQVVFGADGARAAEWYRRAADQGFAPAMNNLAELYLGDLAGPRDVDEAFRWHLAAAEAGNPVGAMNVSLDYRIGRGTPGDLAKADRWADWKATNGMTADLTEPTFGRTELFGNPLPADRRALVRAAAEQGVPVQTTYKPLQPDPRLPTFRQVQRDLSK